MNTSAYMWLNLRVIAATYQLCYMCIIVLNGPMVKGWGLWLREPDSISRTGSHFWFGCGVPFILARSLRNGTKHTVGRPCVCTPHMQSNDPPSASSQRVADVGGHGYRARFWVLRLTLYSREVNSLCIDRQDNAYSLESVIIAVTSAVQKSGTW